MKDQKYQVFISSPFKGLEAQRKAAVQAVVNWEHIPIALEGFSAKAQKDIEVINKSIEDCQIYILILGHRYGSIINEEKISYTEYEFNKAVESKLTVLAFVQNLSEAKQLIESDQRVRNKDEEFQNLESFHEKVRNKCFVKPWGKDTNIEEFFSRALGKALSEEGVKLEGWVRTNKANETLQVKTALKNPFVLKTVTSLNQYKKLDLRCNIGVKQKQAISKFLRQYFLDKIIDGSYSVFFESGSTTAYIASEFGESKRFIDNFSKLSRDSTGRLYTNNILAYLELWVNVRLPITMFPQSSPCEPYGASYGVLEYMIDETTPCFGQCPIDSYAKNAIIKLHESESSLSKAENLIMFGAISGIQVSNNHKIQETAQSDFDETVMGDIKKCFGFHVGGYKNKIFKRYLIETNHPLVVSVNRNKIDMEIDPNKCHFIFDEEKTWIDFCKNHPLALCVGCETEDISEVEEILGKCNCTNIVKLSNPSKHKSILGMTNEFCKRLEICND